MSDTSDSKISKVLIDSLVTPENIGKIIDLLTEVLPPLFEKMSERMQETQDVLSKKIDQIILRDIYSAFDAIRDATSTHNKETRQIRLKFAEESLLRNTGLDPSIKTGDNFNSYWMAQSHHGLMQICLLRNDSKIAVKHLLSTYISDPKVARRKLSPEIFTKIFQPLCRDVYNWEKEQIEEINKNNFSGKIFLKKALAVGKWSAKTSAVVGSWALYLANKKPGSFQPPPVASGRVIEDANKSLEKEWREATPEEHRLIALEKLKIKLEEKLDEKCKEIAISLHFKV